VYGKPIPKDDVDTSNIEWIRMGTTVATNALLERKGKEVVLVITKGFGDVLQIGKFCFRCSLGCHSCLTRLATHRKPEPPSYL
jgi:hypothetical protein